MSVYQALASHLVAEIPVARLQRLFGPVPDDPDPLGGGFCGNNCHGHVGSVCGIRCNPPADAPDVIDRDGQLAFAVPDLKAIRGNLPQLRQAVLEEVTPHLNRLKSLT